jgi:hypothetical protein
MSGGTPAENPLAPWVLHSKAQPGFVVGREVYLNWVATEPTHPDVNFVFARLHGQGNGLATSQLGDEGAVHAYGESSEDPKPVTGSARDDESGVAGAAAEDGFGHYSRD